MRKYALIVATTLAVLMLSAWFLPAQSSQKSREQHKVREQHKEWLAESLREMQKIKVGMSRADLLKVFTTEGGESTGLNRTYVFRACTLIKVDVEFDPVGRPARDGEGKATLVEENKDLIKRISKPYLDWSF